MVYSVLLLLVHSVLGDLVFIESCMFYSAFQFSWHIVVCNNFYNHLYFCGIACNFASFISDFIYLGSLRFFLMSLVKGLSILFIFSKRQLLDVLTLWIVLLVFVSFNSALILTISLFLFILGFVCCCSSCSCRCAVWLFIWNVSIFFYVGPYCYGLPSQDCLRCVP